MESHWKNVGAHRGPCIGLEEKLAKEGADFLFIRKEDKEIVKRRVMEQLSMIKKSVNEIYNLLVGSEETTNKD